MSFKRAIKPFAGVVPPISPSGVGPTSGFQTDPPAITPSGPPRASDPTSRGIRHADLAEQGPLHPTIGVEYYTIQPTLFEILSSLDPVQAVGSVPPAPETFGITLQKSPSRPIVTYTPGDSVSKAPAGMNLATTPSPSPPEHPAPNADIGVIF